MRRLKWLFGITALICCMLAGCKKEEEASGNDNALPSNIEYSNDSEDEVIQQVLDLMLDKNKSADAIMYDLQMPRILTGVTKLEYVVYDNDAIDENGALTGKNEKTEEVTIKVTILKEDKFFKFTVPAGDDLVQAKVDSAAQELLHNIDNIRGNITLRETAGDSDEMTVSWKSSRYAVRSARVLIANSFSRACLRSGNIRPPFVVLAALLSFVGARLAWLLIS